MSSVQKRQEAVTSTKSGLLLPSSSDRVGMRNELEEIRKIRRIIFFLRAIASNPGSNGLKPKRLDI